MQLETEKIVVEKMLKDTEKIIDRLRDLDTWIHRGKWSHVSDVMEPRVRCNGATLPEREPLSETSS